MAELTDAEVFGSTVPQPVPVPIQTGELTDAEVFGTQPTAPSQTNELTDAEVFGTQPTASTQPTPTIKDEDDWFKKVFVTGPGFQIAQIFVENIFEKHVNWTALLECNDNYKNILQVLIQKEFKTTPVYVEISPHNDDNGYHMGVYLCLGQHPHGLRHRDSVPFSKFRTFAAIQEFISAGSKCIYVFLGESKHKIKKKAEQTACKLAIEKIKK